MSAIKTATSALTAVALVTGISFAWAQTEDQQQPTDPVAASTAQPLSEQTPADPNAVPADANAVMPADNTIAVAEQQPADTQPADNTTVQSTTTVDTTTTTTPSPSYDSTTPAPRADRH